MHYDVHKRRGIETSLDRLIGAEELKRYVREMSEVYAHMSQKNVDAIYGRALLLSVNDGEGVHTWVNIITQMWNAFWSTDELTAEFYELRLPVIDDARDIHKTDSRDIVLAAIEEDGILSFGGHRVLCMDISKWVDIAEEAPFRAVLARIRNTTDRQFPVFRIPAVDEVTLRRVREAIGWFMNTDDLYCPPYAIEDYMTYARQWMRDHDVRMEKDTEQMLGELIAARRRSPDFCGFKSVQSLLDDLVLSAVFRACEEGSA